MVPVDSSAVSHVGFEPETSVLWITYTSNRTYRYVGVPAETHAQLMRADSVGKFIGTIIKPNFVAYEVGPMN